MLAKRIIPCLDVKNGRVVKGINFENLQDSGDPLELAIFYDNALADELVFLDISATNEKRQTVRSLVERLARKIFIPFTIGGGISSIEHMVELVQAGADKICLNTAALQNPNLISAGAKILGSQCIVLAVDVKKRADGDWEVYSHAGTVNTGKKVSDWVSQAQDLGVGELLLTSMDKDGTKSGYDLELMQKISQNLNIPLIASGGVGHLQDFYEVFTTGQADAALAASVFHQKAFSIAQVKRFLAEKKVPVRLHDA